MKTLRIGFLGTGWVAELHAKALSRLPGVEIAALCNRHLEKAKAFGDRHTGGRAKCFADFREMLDTVAIDALYICIPPGAHAGQAEAAAERGIHLMLEKPIALTMERAASISEAVLRKGVCCQVGYHMRHTAPARKLKQMLQSGAAGRPLMMQGRFFVNALFPGWWRDPSLGGGQLIEQAIHLYDLARYFLGEAHSLAALADNLAHGRFPDYRVDDVSASTIRFRNGAIASLCAANCAEPGTGLINFTVLCKKVMAEFRGPEEAVFIHHDGKVAEEIVGQGKPVMREQVGSDTTAYEALAEDFIDAIRGNRTARSSVTDGVESLRLVLAAAESARRGGALQALNQQ